MFERMTSHLKRLHRDERGAEGLEKLLIIAAIVLPLLGLLIIFRNEIKDWVVQIWKDARGEAEKNQTDFIGDKLPA
jgi:Flp pilus assembly pilin Flp